MSIYGGFAAPGDDITAEQYTFDPYAGHPDPTGSYHYHAPTPGPLEALNEATQAGKLEVQPQ